MAESHREEAMKLEKKASQISIASNKVPKYSVMSEKLLREASKLYQRAGDARVKEAVEYSSPRRIRDALLTAHHVYGLARKIAEESEKSKIQRKIDSVTAKINELRLQKVSPMNFAILSIISLLAALFFISLNLTGYSIGGLTQNNFRWFGLGLFILGLVFAFFYVKNKK